MPSTNTSSRPTVASMAEVILLAALLLDLCLAKPFPNYAFYDPFPPAADKQFLVGFVPLEEHRQSRPTRDLTDKYADFMDGTREPTCEDLREMWEMAQENLREQKAASRVAKSQSRRSSNTGGAGGGGAHGYHSYSYGPPLQEDDSPVKADRRRTSVPTSMHAKSAAEAAKDSYVYGVVKTHQEEQEAAAAAGAGSGRSKLHVRDPAKEIFGRLRGGGHQGAGASSSSRGEQEAVYGSVRHFSSAADEADARHVAHGGGSSKSPSYLDLVKDKLFSDRDTGAANSGTQSGGGGESYGVVRYSEPEESESSGAAAGSKSLRPFAKLRAMMAAEKAAASPAEPLVDPGAFERIRDRLMSSKHSSRLSGGGSRSFRRKSGSKHHHRRRNARDIAWELAHNAPSALPMTSQLGGGGGYPEQSGFTGVAERVGLREAGEEAGAEAGRRKLRQAARTQAVWRKLRRVLAEKRRRKGRNNRKSKNRKNKNRKKKQLRMLRQHRRELEAQQQLLQNLGRRKKSSISSPAVATSA